MGGCTFITYGIGNDVREAFQMAKDRANDENGHQEGYSGDIQTVSDFVEVPMCGRHPSKLIDAWISEHTRFDPCCAIELRGQSEKKAREEMGWKGRRGSVFMFGGWATC